MAAALVPIMSLGVLLAQVPGDFPPLAQKSAAEIIRPWIKCPAVKFDVVSVESRAADERLVTLRLNSSAWPTVRAILRWSYGEMRGWNGRGYPPGAWEFDSFPDVAQPKQSPNRFDDRSKKAMDEIRSIATAVETYQVDNNEYPLADATNLWKHVVPTYARRLPATDPWGNPYKYLVWGPSPQHYVITSPGADGKYQVAEEALTGLVQLGPRVLPGFGARQDPGDDLIYEDGTFLQWHDLSRQNVTEIPHEGLPCPPDLAAKRNASGEAASPPGHSCSSEDLSRPFIPSAEQLREWPTVSFRLVNETGFALNFAVCADDRLLFQGCLPAVLPAPATDGPRRFAKRSPFPPEPFAQWESALDPATRNLIVAESDFYQSVTVFPIRSIKGPGYLLEAHPDGIEVLGRFSLPPD
jgi:hypothetical protein